MLLGLCADLDVNLNAFYAKPDLVAADKIAHGFDYDAAFRQRDSGPRMSTIMEPSRLVLNREADALAACIFNADFRPRNSG